MGFAKMAPDCKTLPNTDCLDPSLEKSFTGNKSPINKVSFNPDKSQLACAGQDKTVMIWNFRPNTRTYRYHGHKDEVTCVDFSPSGHLLASASLDTTIRFWIPSIKGESAALKAHQGAVRSISYSSDGDLVVTGSDDKTVKVWSVGRQKFVRGFSEHGNWVRDAKFSPDCRLIASCSDDKSIRLWDCNGSAKKSMHLFKNPSSAITSLDFHPSGTCLVAGMNSGSVRVWDIRAMKLIQHYVAHEADVRSVAFHQSGNYLLTASIDKTCRIFDLLEGRLVYTLHGHDREVRSAAFSSSGKRFATAGGDLFVLMWNTNFDNHDYSEDSSRFKNIKTGKMQFNNVPSSDQITLPPKHTGRKITKPLLLTNSKQSNRSVEDIRETPLNQVPEDPYIEKFSSIPESSHDSSMGDLKNLITQGFSRIQTQIDLMTQTSMMLEQRLTNVEEKLDEQTQKNEYVTVQPRKSKTNLGRKSMHNMRQNGRVNNTLTTSDEFSFE